MQQFNHRAVSIFILILSVIDPLVCADDMNANGAIFLYPPASLTPNYLDTINTTWTSLFQTPYLYTCCRNSTGGVSISNYLTFPRGARLTISYTEKHYQVATNGSSTVVLDFKNMSTCWFNIRPQDWYVPESGSNSEEFVIVPGMRVPYPATWTLEDTTEESSSSSPATSTVTDSATKLIPEPSSSPTSDKVESTALSSSTTSRAAVETTRELSHDITSVPIATPPNPMTVTRPSSPLPTSGDHKDSKTAIKVGVGVSGATIIACSVALAVYIFARRSRRRRNKTSNHPYGGTPPPRPPRPASVMSATPSYSTTAPLARPQGVLIESIQGDSPIVDNGSLHSHDGQDISPRTESLREISSTRSSGLLGSRVEVNHIDTAIHELYSPIQIHEIGPGRWENTGFNFPPEKSARC